MISKMPRRVLALSLYGERGNVELSTKHSGSASIHPYRAPDAVGSLVAALENHGRSLSIWSRFLWWIPLVREQSVVSARRRDEVDDRIENRRNAMISAVLGLLGGVIGGVATIVASGR